MTPLPRRVWHQLALWLVAAVVGALVLWLSDLLQRPAAVAFADHGTFFQAMTVDPLSLRGKFPQRILWPLLAHGFGLHGPRAPVFSQVCNGALLAVVFWFCRQRGARWPDALLVTVAVAMTGAVQVYKAMACFSDPLNFLLLLLALHWVRRPAVFWSLVLLSAFSHEMVFFFAPWLVYVRCRAGGLWWREGLTMGGIVGVYVAWQWLVKQVASGGSFDSGYYFANNFWVPWGLPAMWSLWAFLLLVEFGPLLAVVVWAWRRGELGMGRWGPWLYLAGVMPLMLLAYDVMRFASFAFLPLVLGSLALLRCKVGRPVMGCLLLGSIATYAWLHPNQGEQGGAAFTRISGEILALLPGRVAPQQPMALSDAMSFTAELFLRTWPIALAAIAAALLLLLAGLLLARYVPGEPRTTLNASP